jgi:hypothetical protein
MFKKDKGKFAFPWDRKPQRTSRKKAALGIGAASAVAVIIAGLVEKKRETP